MEISAAQETPPTSEGAVQPTSVSQTPGTSLASQTPGTSSEYTRTDTSGASSSSNGPAEQVNTSILDLPVNLESHTSITLMPASKSKSSAKPRRINQIRPPVCKQQDLTLPLQASDIINIHKAILAADLATPATKLIPTPKRKRQSSDSSPVIDKTVRKPFSTPKIESFFKKTPKPSTSKNPLKAQLESLLLEIDDIDDALIPPLVPSHLLSDDATMATDSVTSKSV